MLGLAILFAILAILFGVWGYGPAAAPAWAGAEIFFWIFIALFINSLVFGPWWRRRPLP
jgi:uncharacterized membrane protein YtjA (UPF0391 family)